MRKTLFWAGLFCCFFPSLVQGAEWKISVRLPASFAQIKREARQDKQPESFLELGKAYYFGLGTKKDLKKARKYFQKAARAELPEAILWLAVLNTKEKKNPQLVQQGVKEILRLAQDDYSLAQYKAAHLYAEGIGIEADPAKSISWLKRAATAPLAIPQAQVRLGKMYYTGYPPYIEKNSSEAFKLFLPAADAEESEAQHYTALLYLSGDGTEKNEKQAFKYMRQAARQGLVAAQKELSELYRTGTGVKQNEYSAFKWMHEAARNGNISAQEQTALNYWHGYGIPKNVKEARFWAFQAKNKGSKKAEEILQQIQEENP